MSQNNGNCHFCESVANECLCGQELEIEETKQVQYCDYCGRAGSFSAFEGFTCQDCENKDVWSFMEYLTRYAD